MISYHNWCLNYVYVEQLYLTLFTGNLIDGQSLKVLSAEDIKELIPQLGLRHKFARTFYSLV